MNIVNITHTDLDGIACAALVRSYFGDVKTIHASYSDIESKIRTVLSESPDIIIITDIFGGKDLLASYSGHLYVFDHHLKGMKEAAELREIRNKPTDLFVLSDRDCGAMLFAKTFGLVTKTIEAVNEYDLTGCMDGVPGDLNILHRILPYKDMEEVILRPEPVFTEDEADAIFAYRENQRKYFDRLERDIYVINGYKIGVVRSEHYRDYVLDRLRDKYDIAICFYGSSGVSLRSNIVPVNNIAARFGGGGHKYAAGINGNVSIEDILKEVEREVG